MLDDLGTTGGGTGGGDAGSGSAGVVPQGSAGGSGTPAVTPGAAAAPAGGQAAQAAAPQLDANGKPVAPQYTPNFKFKYRGLDKNEVESEIDELYRPLVRDADTEKKLREMHEKAFGLDFVKSDRDGLKTRYEPMEQQFVAQSQALQRLSHFIKGDDFDSFVKTLKLPEEMVMKWALKKAQIAQMDPAQRAAAEAEDAKKSNLIEAQMENARLSEEISNLNLRTRTVELEGALGQPQVSEAAKAYDQRVGKPGAFKSLVIQRGQWYALTQGIDVPAAQVVQEVSGMFGGIAPAPAGQQGGAPVGAQGQAKPPVLPRVDGKGTSPAKKTYNSVDALRARAAELGASNVG